jgi:hypothetical protein
LIVAIFDVITHKSLMTSKIAANRRDTHDLKKAVVIHYSLSPADMKEFTGHWFAKALATTKRIFNHEDFITF